MDFETAFRRIKELKRENSVAKEILDLYQNILEFQRTSFERTGINYEELPASLAVEKPLIQIIEKEIKSENISKLFEDFFEFISLFGTPQMKESAKKAKGNRYFSPEKVKESLTGYLLEGKEIPDVPPEFLRLSVLSVTPILLSPVSKRLQEQLTEDFESTNCPYCGSKALIGYFKKEKEGKRFLICPVCYGEWPIKRDVCANCGNEDLEEHYYFIPESKEDKHLRVDICNKCKHYIKTVDERVLSDEGKTCSPLVEDLATPYIDIRLLEEGYEKATKNLFGF